MIHSALTARSRVIRCRMSTINRGERVLLIKGSHVISVKFRKAGIIVLGSSNSRASALIVLICDEN